MLNRHFEMTTMLIKKFNFIQYFLEKLKMHFKNQV